MPDGEVATPNLVGKHDAASEARHPSFRNDDTRARSVPTHAGTMADRKYDLRCCR